MASYKGHLAFASTLAAGYGSLGVLQWNFDWGDACLAAGLCTVGGVLPDLDSDSSVPVRELFGIAAAVGSLLAYARLRHGLNHEQAILIAGLIYLFIRYAVSQVFKWLTVHRGMFHSLPAMCIAGLGVYLLQPGSDPAQRQYLAAAMALGYLSHLVLDEIYAVDMSGVKIRFNKFAGSAVKFWSKSMVATLTCYAILAALVFVAVDEGALLPQDAPAAIQKPITHRPILPGILPNRPTQPTPTPTPKQPASPGRWDQPRFPATSIPGPGE
jgi:membrane-bound metal-dependent hydrolase YbcI (DUF457 family)